MLNNTHQDSSHVDTPRAQNVILGDARPSLHIGIIGSGPRGISVVERICASVAADYVLRIHIIDPYMGGGSVWNSSRNSNELLMNTIASQVTVFTDPTVACLGPIREGPSLWEWSTQPQNADRFRLGPNDYPTRADYGHYLTWAQEHIQRRAPENVHFKMHLARAIRLDNDPYGRYQTITLSNGQMLQGITAVVLAQGHLPQELTLSEQYQADHARAKHLRYISPANPATVELGMIKGQEKVFLRGLGLCFFDYISRFTTGRQGKYTENPDGTLTYHASGHEPLLYAGSSRGIPSHARPDNQKGIDEYHRPLLLTNCQLDRFRRQANQGKHPNFSQDILPLLMREMECVYYVTLLKQRGQEPETFQQLALADPYSPLTPQMLRRFGIRQEDQDSWESSLKPLVPSKITRAAHKDWIISYLTEDSKQAALGNIDGPHAAARDSLRDLRNQIRLAIDHDGISGKSRRVDVDKTFTPLSNFLSVGPPKHRIDELIALIKAGVVNILGPKITMEHRGNMWVIKSPNVPDYELEVTTLIEARLPRPSLSTTTDPLLSHLLKTGQCRPHIIDDYETGAIDITEAPYCLKDRRGQPHPARFAIGVPTEGIHWTTTAGARPGVDSAMLQECDRVAHEICALLKDN
ncbi:hypothetical protein Daesc_008904 [Daldinia eschscholtzii]|uniref:FAD-dependent urate hydroxylase HpyO/Asp monooxygenase CreE-like FAD/NAD(P)-binding domain-containing protein n=1 Tax=Daldinia eschscholtzii TaxID=292717 RepID=A0AAX6MDS4_9PEZI